MSMPPLHPRQVLLSRIWDRILNTARFGVPLYIEESDISESHRISAIDTKPHPSIRIYDDIVCIFFENNFNETLCEACNGRTFVRGIGDRIIKCEACAPSYHFFTSDPDVIDQVALTFVAMEEMADGRY